jgi:hypothetical protein
LKGRIVAACSALIAAANCSSPAVSGGGQAQEVAAALAQLENGNAEPCIKLMRNAPMAASDIIGSASALCHRTYENVTEIVQRDEGKRSIVTIRFDAGDEIEFRFQNGRLEGVHTGYAFPTHR